MSKKITIREVAKQAGVSISSVHLALNGKPGVSDTIRSKICSVAEELGYQPNQMASGLKRKPRHVVIFLPDETGDNRYYYPPVWKGIRDYLANASDMKIECTEIQYTSETDFLSSEGLSYLRRLIHDKKVDGILMAGHMNAFSQEEWDTISQSGISVVLIGSDNPASHRICCIQPDYDVIGRTMAESILSHIQPYGSIVLNSGNPNWNTHSLIVKGFEDYMKENHADNLVYKLNNWNITDDDYDAFLRAIQRPDVAACCSVLARGTLLLGRALQELYRSSDKRLFSIGNDLSEYYVDLLRNGTFNNLVEKNPYAQGYLGIRRLTEYLLSNKIPEHDIVYVGSKMVFRSSLKLNDMQNDQAMLF